MDKYSGNEVLIRQEEFGDIHEDFIEDLREASEEVLEKQPLSAIRSLASFLQLWNVDGREYSRILSKKKTRMGNDIISIEKNCLDPAILLKDVVEGAHSNIFMSGTLYPLDMYENIFNLKNPMKLDFKNPYPKENRLDLVLPLVSTRYSSRSEEMYERIAMHCKNLIKEIKGNKIFFFPSYDLLARIRLFFEDEDIAVEEQGMDKSSKEALLNKFRISSNNVLFAVSAGSFGEGINLEGEALSGVVIVGIPFARFDLIAKELTRYYDEKFDKGQEYGYVLPAFTKVLQNAGRCIRSETDKGVIVYLDERYSWNNYTKYFPSSIDLKKSNNYELLKKFYES
jgi:Rad3-related DNA helicase